jgi:puromycin-sensitive aminopeptidase
VADQPSYRLPRAIVPHRYVLELSPDLEAATFSGTALIDVRVDAPVDDVILNAAELSIDRAWLRPPGGSTSEAASVELDEEEQRAILRFDSTLAAGEGYQLGLEFRGVLNDKLRGFYRSTFTDTAGTEHTIATTQFEPADARRAFPCWDEPDFKATFTVSLVIDDALTAISNGAVVSEEAAGAGKRRVRFAETIPMSTYLVAFIVGPFELTALVDVDGVPLQVAAVSGKAHITGFAQECGVHALRFLSRYFELPYPGDKIDHVAIPDFAFGAMENLGCVTYRETALLVDPAAASQLELQRVSTVVAHETAHMWFGDLVTMKWWNGIWLNEAFATFMELTTTDDFRPDWAVWTTFGAGKAAAMATDGLRATRPVEFTVGRPEEAEAMFDVLTYQKGGAVLRMLEQYLGQETFRKGIAHYLREHRFGNTETTDLWDAIEAASGEPVRQIMDSWIFQGGYPLITVEVDGGSGGHALRLRQERFIYDGHPGDERWVVPINLRASVGGSLQRQRLLLDAESATISFDGPVDWVVVNDGAWGFYRVAYAPELQRRLTDQLPSGADALERMGLVVDTWAAVVSGTADLPGWVGVVGSLGDEEDPDVWGAVLSPLALVDHIVANEDRGVLQAYVRRVGGPTFARLGWDPAPGEPQRQGTVRARLLGALGSLGADPEVRAEAVARVHRFFTDRSALAPDIVTAAVNVMAAAGGAEAWETLLAQYRQAELPQDKIRYLYALAETEDPVLLGRTLDLCLSPEVRNQDAPFVVGSVLGGRAGGRVAWEWIVRRWSEVSERFPAGMIVRMLEGISGLVEPDLAASVHEFLAAHPVPSGGPRLKQLEERMDIHVALAGRLRPELRAALGG